MSILVVGSQNNKVENLSMWSTCNVPFRSERYQTECKFWMQRLLKIVFCRVWKQGQHYNDSFHNSAWGVISFDLWQPKCSSLIGINFILTARFHGIMQYLKLQGISDFNTKMVRGVWAGTFHHSLLHNNCDPLEPGYFGFGERRSYNFLWLQLHTIMTKTSLQ